MQILKDNIVLSAAGKSFLLDVFYKENQQAKPVLIFAHGFKGFKDWGHWEMIAEHFAELGYVFVKFNFSHNGTTVDNPLDFDDLEAFGQNNYSKELSDLEAVLNWLEAAAPKRMQEELDLARIALIGHSRGGAISLIKAAQDQRVKALVTWAAVSRLDYAWQAPFVAEHWKEMGVYYILNGRTKQQMPLYIQLYEDFNAHSTLLDTKKAAQNFKKPFLIIHGDKDPAVSLGAAQELQKWQPNATLIVIENGNHVFGGRHPYVKTELSAEARELIEGTHKYLVEKI